MGTGHSSTASRAQMTAEDVVQECQDNSRIKDLHILVTGATSGIGVETSRVLALAGSTVYLMGRSETKLEEVIQTINKELQEKSTNRGSVQGVICDLNSLASIKECAEKLIREGRPLNMLILNAGLINSSFHQTVDGLEQVIGVNHLAHAYLTKLLMPTLIANAPSRLVVVSARLHFGPPLDYATLDQMSSTAANAGKGFGIRRSYQQSKLANILFARAIAARYKDQHISAFSLHPGVITTNLGATVPLVGVIKTLLKDKTTAQGAATTVYCALKTGLEKENGRYFDNSTVTNIADKWSDDDVNKCWDWTEKVLQDRTARLE